MTLLRHLDDRTQPPPRKMRSRVVRLTMSTDAVEDAEKKFVLKFRDTGLSKCALRSAGKNELVK